MRRIGILVVLALPIAIRVALLFGVKRWQAETRNLHTRMRAGRVQITLTTYDPHTLETLPPPVQRYFRTVLPEGQPLIATVGVEHTGAFNVSETDEQWKPFTSTQRVLIQRPGFVWDARIRIAPATTMYVHDAYAAGEGILTANLLGLLTVMDQPSTPELAQGELLRFFAEAAWYPTALLPGHSIVWEAIDDAHAQATLTDGTNKVKLTFAFDDQGLISSVRTDERYRLVDGKLFATPWQVRFGNYERRDGMLIPLEGEVEWLLPEGARPYWRGRIQRITYEYA